MRYRIPDHVRALIRKAGIENPEWYSGPLDPAPDRVEREELYRRIEKHQARRRRRPDEGETDA